MIPSVYRAVQREIENKPEYAQSERVQTLARELGKRVERNVGLTEIALSDELPEIDLIDIISAHSEEWMPSDLVQLTFEFAGLKKS